MLLDNLDRDLAYALQHDAKWKGAADDCANYEQVKAAIAAKLEALRDTPNRYVNARRTRCTSASTGAHGSRSAMACPRSPGVAKPSRFLCTWGRLRTYPHVDVCFTLPPLQPIRTVSCNC